VTPLFVVLSALTEIEFFAVQKFLHVFDELVIVVVVVVFEQIQRENQ
jgi:hypothetical protein